MDDHMIGVVSGSMAVVDLVSHDSQQGGVNVIVGGTALVRVSTINGQIHAGDFISSSVIPGIGAKAPTYGLVLGIALADYTETNPRKIEKIPLFIHMIVQAPLTNSAAYPFEASRYVMAFVIAVGSVITGFIYFGKKQKARAEALSRDASSGRITGFGVFLNILLTIGIMVVGVAISYLIIIL